MISFHVLGTLDLRGPSGQHLGSPITGSKRLALLSYLTLARPRGFHRRDTVLGLFWPETEQRKARNALSNMLHQIRRSLGSEIIQARGIEEVAVDQERLRCDAVIFDELLDRGDRAEALELYRGDLLEGLYVSGASPRFDQWLENERSRLRTRAADGARGLIEAAHEAGQSAEALRWARKAVDLDPVDERAVRRLMTLSFQAGDRIGALRAYENLAETLFREFEVEPSRETREILERGRQAAVAGAPEEPGRGVERKPGGENRRLVAVLPFQDLSGSGSVEPFVAGLHDDLITELSRLSGLSVISRSSVMRLHGPDRSIREIAQILGAGTVVEGAVQRIRGRLRVNVQLVDGEDETQIWAERYDRQLTADDLFDIQTELAEEIAGATHAEISPEERRRLQKIPTESLEAFRLRAQGRAQLDRRTEEGMRQAVAQFREAIAEDPGFVLAWVGLADALTLLFDYGYASGEEALPRAEEAIRRALEIEPSSAEAFASLGLLESNRRKGPEAIEALKRAVELRPGYAEAHNWLSWVYQVMGEAEEALASARLAVRLDPLSPEAVSNLSLSLLENGQAGMALREARRARTLQPDWSTAAFYEGLALFHMDRFAEAERVLRGLEVPWAGSGPDLTAALARLAMGENTPHIGALDTAMERDDGFEAGLMRLAQGEGETGLELLTESKDWGYWPVFSVHHFYPAILGPLRKDPRFERIRQKARAAWGG